MADKKERGDGRKKGKRKIDAPARARATLNILMAQYRRQCYRGRSVRTHNNQGQWEAPLLPPFFSRLQFNTQIGSRDNATGPRKQPLSLPFPHTHAHASRGGNRGEENI